MLGKFIKFDLWFSFKYLCLVLSKSVIVCKCGHKKCAFHDIYELFEICFSYEMCVFQKCVILY